MVLFEYFSQVTKETIVLYIYISKIVDMSLFIMGQNVLILTKVELI